MLWEGLEYSRCWQEVTEAIPVKACLSLGPGAKVTARSKVHRSGEALRCQSRQARQHSTLSNNKAGFLQINLGYAGGIYMEHMLLSQAPILLRLFAPGCRKWTLHSQLLGPRCRAPSCKMKKRQACAKLKSDDVLSPCFLSQV